MEVTTLNVAINSELTTFYTILLSNSIGEVKIRVFKKFDEKKTQNLVQKGLINKLKNNQFLDGVEWVQKSIYCFIVILQPKSLALDCVRKFVYMVVSEIIVDSVKYLFISKNNNLNWNMFKKYKQYLSQIYLFGYYKKNKQKDMNKIYQKMKSLTILSKKDIDFIEQDIPDFTFKPPLTCKFILIPHASLITQHAFPILITNLINFFYFLILLIILKIIAQRIIWYDLKKTKVYQKIIQKKIA